MSLPILRRSAARADLLQIWSHIAVERDLHFVADKPLSAYAMAALAAGYIIT